MEESLSRRTYCMEVSTSLFFFGSLARTHFGFRGKRAGALEPTDNGFLVVVVVQELLQETREISLVKRGAVLVVTVRIRLPNSEIFLHHLFMGTKTDTSSGCIRSVLFSGRKQNLKEKNYFYIICYGTSRYCRYFLLCNHFTDRLKPSRRTKTICNRKICYVNYS
jgi:hypothetical protein